jgi:NhaC family Na+:H+ antiporter
MVVLVPAIVIGLIIKKKTEPLIALLIGTLLAAVFFVIFQPQILNHISGLTQLTFKSGYKAVMDAITGKSLFQQRIKNSHGFVHLGGMQKML